MLADVEKKSTHRRRSPEHVSFHDALNQGAFLIRSQFFGLRLRAAGDCWGIYLHGVGFYGKKFAIVKAEKGSRGWRLAFDSLEQRPVTEIATTASGARSPGGPSGRRMRERLNPRFLQAEADGGRICMGTKSFKSSKIPASRGISALRFERDDRRGVLRRSVHLLEFEGWKLVHIMRAERGQPRDRDTKTVALER